MEDRQKAGVAVVTGGSRGVGRGIAVALGAHGYTVYVTGRTQRTGESSWGGTIHDTAAAVTAAGGKGVAVRVDHRDDAETAALFERVRRDDGRLDILVNNAALIRRSSPGTSSPRWRPTRMSSRSADTRLSGPKWRDSTGSVTPTAGARHRSAS